MAGRRGMSNMDLLDREDGELSDGEIGQRPPRMKAGADVIREQGNAYSVSTEHEIDRILNEVAPYNNVRVATPNIRNMLDPQYLQNAASAESVICELDDAEGLRHAALASMYKNGPEDGELRDDRSRSPQRPKFNERLQLTNYNNDPFRRYPNYNYNYNYNYNNRRTIPDFENFRKRGRKHRSPSQENKGKLRRRNLNRSQSHEKRRAKETREEKERRRDNSEVPANQAPVLSPMANIPTTEIFHKNRRFRSDTEHQMVIFGEEEVSGNASVIRQPAVHDNQDVSMDVDSDERSSPASPPQARRSIEDETDLRRILMEQIKNKNGNDEQATPASKVRRSSTQSVMDNNEQQYISNRNELCACEAKMASQQDITQNLYRQKQRLIKELEAVMSKLADSQGEYWKARERRDILRPLVEKHEDNIMLKIADNDMLGSFFQSMEENSLKINAIATDIKLKLKSNSIPNSPAEPISQIQHKNVVIEHGEQDMDLSLTPAYSPEEENELQLRQILLEKQKNKEAATKTSKNNPNVVAHVQAPSPSIAPDSIPLPPEEAPKDSFRPESPTKIPESAKANTEDAFNTKVTRAITESGIPIRLFSHAGVEIPSKYQAERTICPFELAGKCKDVGCQHRHLNEDSLKLREILSMIVCYKQSINNGYMNRGTEHKSQVEYLLSLYNEQEEEVRKFTQRIMKPHVEESQLLNSGFFKLTECN